MSTSISPLVSHELGQCQSKLKMGIRLLDTSSLCLKAFEPGRAPTYAILSHLWDEEEVLFHDINGHNTLSSVPSTSTAATKNGFVKVRESARIAREQGYRYIWIDTCCIDKKSSVELSEAINTMFLWYQLSEVCLVFMNDVQLDTCITDQSSFMGKFQQSRWFRRGWTLQELIAPGKVIFYDVEWRRIGSRSEFADGISVVTRIPRHILDHDAPYDPADPTLRYNLSKISVASRFNWAADRETTRVEDKAYSLLGLFNLAMPTLYGEGTEAFQRLQESLLAITDDQTLLCYRPGEWLVYNNRPFATSPDQFLPNVEGLRDYAAHQPMVRTNRGLELDVELCKGRLIAPPPGPMRMGIVWVAGLECMYLGDYLSRPGILLQSTNPAMPVSQEPRLFRRSRISDSLLRLSPGDMERTLFGATVGMTERNNKCK